jgi:hypothetical protein
MKVFSAFTFLLLSSCGDAFHPSLPKGNVGPTVSAVRSESALCMATIAVFGASGLTASECVYQALQDGDNVVGLTR